MNIDTYIKEFKQYAVKFDHQQKYKAMLEAAIVSTPKGLVEKIQIAMGKPGTLMTPSAINSISPFLELLDVT